MKVLWMSDSPTSPSGFGNVTRFVCAGLADLGHEVSILGWQARGTAAPWRNCTVYPIRHDSFGADVLLGTLSRLRPDVLLTLADVWWLTYISHPAIASFMRTAGIPWLLYYPIDGDLGGGRLPSSWVHVLQTVSLPIAMSRYGREATQANGLTPAYIPHGVEASVFRPPPDHEAAKSVQGYQGKFVVLSDARNQPRKMWPRTLEIFRRFAHGKDDVLLHLHCDPDDPAARSREYHYSLRKDVEFLGLVPKVRFTPGMSIATGIPLAQLAAIYQAADVHLLSSWGEGFGLPSLQAAAAGVVPMASDYTASRELVQGHGEAIRVKHFLPDQFGLRRALIDIDDAVDKLEHLYRDRAAFAFKSGAARRFAEEYDWPRIIRQWHDLLRQEVPRLRRVAGRAPGAFPVTLRPEAAAGPSRLADTVRRAFPKLPDGIQVTLKVVENKAGQLTAEVFHDACHYESILTIPVTLPPADAAGGQPRDSGSVYLAGRADFPVFLELQRIFPGLKAWASGDLGRELAQNQKPYPLSITGTKDAAWQPSLAVSVLALDLEGLEPQLPLQAARFGVPCIFLGAHSEHVRLWPDLALSVAVGQEAVKLGRWVLTDQGDSAVMCARAQQLAGLIPAGTGMERSA